MGFTESVSKRELGVRWLVVVILVPGLFLQRAAVAIALASLACFLAEGYRIRSMSRRTELAVEPGSV